MSILMLAPFPVNKSLCVVFLPQNEPTCVWWSGWVVHGVPDPLARSREREMRGEGKQVRARRKTEKGKEVEV